MQLDDNKLDEIASGIEHQDEQVAHKEAIQNERSLSQVAIPSYQTEFTSIWLSSKLSFRLDKNIRAHLSFD